MNFGKYMDKHVRITFTDGKFLEGVPYCFSGADDNPEGIASIRMDGYELYENEIDNIEVLTAASSAMASAI